jgi:uncharacterized protein YndB with AHSA1/START domain
MKPSNLVIEKSIEIHAPASKVWRVFTDPVLTRQMGGEYVSDWKVGSSFGWKGLDGKLYTRGTILKIEPEKLLQHNLFRSVAEDLEHVSAITSVITYELRQLDGRTMLLAREEFTDAMQDKEYADASEGWDAALAVLKEVAEK